MDELTKGLLERLVEQDKRSFMSLSRADIQRRVEEHFRTETFRTQIEAFASVLVISIARPAVELCRDMVPQLEDDAVKAALENALYRACQSGEFNTSESIAIMIRGLIPQIMGRVIDRLSFMISETHALNNSTSRKLLEE
jgi:hypothetical protein